MSQLQVTGEAKIRDIQGPVVANSGVITALDGAASQYVRGDGTLADFPTSTGGGSSVSYYLNGSVNQGTFGGSTYYEMNKSPIIGAGTDFPVSTNGLVAQFITDANDPDLLEVPGGNFNVEFYFSVSNNTGNPTVYAELYKYDGTTFTLLGSSQAVPESLNQGTTIAPYYFAIPVGTAALALTDRIAIRIYANVDGRTVTLHTENSHLCQVVTTFSKGMVSLNNLTDQSQFITTGTSGTDFNIVSSGDTHTFNIPSASNNNRGLITNLAQTIGGIKTFSSNINADSGIRLKNGVAPSANGYVGIGSNTQGLTLGVYDSGSAYYHELYFPYTNGYEYTFPATSGTLALTSNLSSYVPYTGATTNVDLGIYNIFSSFVYAEGAGGSTNGGILIKQYSGALAANSGYTSLFATPNQLGINFSGVYNTFLQSGTLTASRTYTLPDLSGTLALLEGTQTFSGAKTFSGGASFTLAGGIVGFSGGVAVDKGTAITKGSTPASFSPASATMYSALGDNNLIIRDSTNTSTLQFQASGSNTYTFPAATGTIALTSNLSSYVPYTGATGNVDLGSNHITSATIVFWKGTGSGLGNIGIGRIVPLGQNTTGQVNIGIGENSLFYNTTGSNNIALGGSANGNNTTGSSNIGIGSSANYANTTASNNIAIGLGALANNTVDNNVAIGHVASYFNTTGNFNVAVGYATLYTNTTGSSNTAIGSSALYSTTTGVQNTAIGKTSMFYNTTGGSNTAIGTASLQSNTTGSSNTGIGTAALGSNTTGIGNIAIGNASGFAIITGSNNTIIGNYAGTSAMSNNIVLADGAGNIRYQWNGTNNVFGNPISGTSATFSSSIFVNSPLNNTVITTSDATNITNGFNLLASSSYWGIRTSTNGNFNLDVFGAGVPKNALIIAQSTGAATFSSSVTAGDQVYVTAGNGNQMELDNTGQRYTQLNFRNSGTQRAFLATDQTASEFQIYGQAGFALALGAGGGEKMRITSGGNVGIGTSSPTRLLDVNGVIRTQNAGSAGAPSIELGTSAQGNGLFYPATNTIAIATNDTERMRITSNGNVLIGTTTDNGRKLQVAGGALFTGGNNSGASFNIIPDATGQNGVDLNTSYFTGTGYGPLTFTVGGSERMRITSTGVVELNAADATYISYKYAGTVKGLIGVAGASTDIISGASAGDLTIRAQQNMLFSSGGDTERMRITSGGYLKLREATSSTTEVHILRADTTTDAVAQVVNANTSTTSDGLFAVSASRNTTNNTFYALGYYNAGAGAWKFRVADSGNVTNTNNSYGVLSDVKLKENIVDATPKLEDLLKVKIRNYNLIGEETKQIGVIAQELEQIFPSMIDESEDFEEVEITDENGNTTKQKQSLGTTTKSVKMSVFVPMLIKAIQEQQAQINELKALINK